MRGPLVLLEHLYVATNHDVERLPKDHMAWVEDRDTQPPVHLIGGLIIQSDSRVLVGVCAIRQRYDEQISDQLDGRPYDHYIQCDINQPSVAKGKPTYSDADRESGC
jgi:hypothetical protein